MTAPSCDLCGLPLPASPYESSDDPGRYCCRGCLNVAREMTGSGAPSRDFESTVPEGSKRLETVFLAVEGMHCTACESFLEHRATSLSGVEEAAANHGASLMQIRYDPDRIGRADIVDGVGGYGYRPRRAGEPSPGETDPETVGRLLVGGFFGMMTMVWYGLFLYPVYLGARNPVMSLSGAAGQYLLWNLALMAAVVLVYTGYPILRGAWVSLVGGRPNMDFLIALAGGTAYLYSLGVLLRGGHEVYFDITVVILVAVTAGQYYRDQTSAEALDLVSTWSREQEPTVRRQTGEGTESVGVDRLNPGDEILVRPGERVPLDGVVTEGRASVDESLITGRVQPSTRSDGDTVVGGSVVLNQPLVIRVDEPDSLMDRIASTLWSIQTRRGGLERTADRLAGVFVPLVLIAAGAASVWAYGRGAATPDALLTGLAVLVVSCPCALGLATPLAVASGVRRALRNRIVVKDGGVFEDEPGPGTVVFDKTGTLTRGTLEVLAAPPTPVRRWAARLEQFSNHPVARCILDHEETVDGEARDVRVVPGRGVAGTVNGHRVRVGNREFFGEDDWRVREEHRTRYEGIRASGNRPVLVGRDGTSRGLYELGDRPRDDREEVLDDLDARGYRVRILTGDDRPLPADLREHPAVDEFHRGVTPQQKQAYLRRWKRDGPVIMVGDGINDAPALARGDLGVALSDGAATAFRASDAVITDGKLSRLVDLLDLREATRRILRQNLAWAFLYNGIAIPAAFLGSLNPLVAAVAMSLSSLVVVVNSRRLAPGG